MNPFAFGIGYDNRSDCLSLDKIAARFCEAGNRRTIALIRGCKKVGRALPGCG